MRFLIISLIIFLVTSQIATSRTRMLLEIVNSIDFDENSTNSCYSQKKESNSIQHFGNKFDECLVDDSSTIELKSYLTKLSDYF